MIRPIDITTDLYWALFDTYAHNLAVAPFVNNVTLWGQLSGETRLEMRPIAIEKICSCIEMVDLASRTCKIGGDEVDLKTGCFVCRGLFLSLLVWSDNGQFLGRCRFEKIAALIHGSRDQRLWLYGGLLMTKISSGCKVGRPIEYDDLVTVNNWIGSYCQSLSGEGSLENWVVMDRDSKQTILFGL